MFAPRSNSFYGNGVWNSRKRRRALCISGRALTFWVRCDVKSRKQLLLTTNFPFSRESPPAHAGGVIPGT